VCQELGIDSSVVPRIATPFAGGIRRTDAVRGVVGGTTAIGLRHGREQPAQARGVAFRAVMECLGQGKG
jgi:hypothetical protein